MFKQKKITLNTIEEKEQSLKNLQNQSTNALGMITKTIEDLSAVNEAIEKEVEEINIMRDNLLSTRDNLHHQKSSNKKIIDKFTQLIQDDE